MPLPLSAPHRLGLLWFLACLPGCVIISEDEYAERLAGLKDSSGWDGGDGAEGGGDSDPPDPSDSGEDCTEAVWYADGDGDGYGDAGSPVDICLEEVPEGVVEDSSDCDDANPDWHEPALLYPDEDGDGYGRVGEPVELCGDGGSEEAGDCDDSDAAVSPALPEDCATTVDDNCDGDDNDLDALGCTDFYVDADGDSVGAGEALCSCAPRDGHSSAENNDCDDSLSSTSPLATELCNNGADDDCDGDATDCRTPASLDLSGADARLLGQSGRDWTGQSVSGAPDMDGDGRAELLVSAHQADASGANAGLAWLVSGASVGDVALSTSTALAIAAEAASDQAGYALVGAGDLTGDGAADLIVGAPAWGSSGDRPGAVYIVPGPLAAVGALSLSGLPRYEGDVNGDLAGSSLAAVGDADGDGVEDALVGAYKTTGGGTAWLLRGPLTEGGALAEAALTFQTGVFGDRTGFGLSGAGDVDGDGLPELAIAADRSNDPVFDAGVVYLLSGELEGIIGPSEADHSVHGESASQWVGYAIASAGDDNGDGYADLWVAAPGQDEERGAVYLLHGPTPVNSVADAAASWVGIEAGDRAGRSLAGGQDVDGDGSPDLLVGAPATETTRAGAAYLIYGPSSGATSLSLAHSAFSLSAESSEVGYSTALVGDVDGDSWAELLIGAPWAPGQSSQAGAAWLITVGGL